MAVVLKSGRDLVVGDVIRLWMQGGAPQRITALRPYTGPLRHLWDKDGGARLAETTPWRLGLTIDP